MAGGSRVSVSRHSKRFNGGISSDNSSNEQLSDASSIPGGQKRPFARHNFSSHLHDVHVADGSGDLLSMELLDPKPLCVIPVGELAPGIGLPKLKNITSEKSSAFQSDIADRSSHLIPRSCLDQQSTGSAGGRSVSTSDATFTEAGVIHQADNAQNFQLALCPVANDEHMAHGTYSMVPYGYGSGVAEPQPVMKFSSRESRDKRTSDLRRANIKEGLEALKKSVPCSDNSDKANMQDAEGTVLEDAIDYIKFLKLQLKFLSQSRLIGNYMPHSLVHLEGYGHYLLDPRARQEPLEDMIGHLLKENPEAANELLRSKGLMLLPMNAAYNLLPTI